MVDADRERQLRKDIEALYFGYRAFTSVPDQILAERGLGRAHHRILYFVRQQPGISTGGLLRVLNVTKQAIHRPIKELEALGLVTLTPDPQDRRVRRVTATREGAELESKLTGAQMRLLEDVFAGVESGTEASWRTVLLQLAKADSGPIEMNPS